MIADPLWSCVMLLCGPLWVLCGPLWSFAVFSHTQNIWGHASFRHRRIGYIAFVIRWYFLLLALTLTVFLMTFSIYTVGAAH